MIIRKLRLEKGFSQEQLADMTDVSTRTIQRLERGAKATPETLKCLAAVLDVDFTELRKDDDMPNGAFSTDISLPTPTLPANEREAMEYVRDIKAFYVHAIQYGVVMVLLVVVNLWFTPGFWWVVFPAIGWGIGLAVHGMSVFETIDLFGQNWERRQIERRMRKEATRRE